MNVSSVNEPRKYLIAIGSSSCTKINPHKLQRVEGDIRKIDELLVNKEQGYQRVLADQIYIDATSGKIRHALSSWFSSEERNNSDCIIIYYAGHADEGEEQNSHYLYTFESNKADLPNTTIKTDDLVKYLFPGKVNYPQNILLILDVCYAGKGASNVLVSSLTQCQTATKNISFWIIASADSNTEAGDGDFVDALEKAMKSDNWKQKDKDEFIKIDDLLNCINNYLQENQLSQKAEASCSKLLSSPTFIRNPFFSNPNKCKFDKHKLEKDSTKTKSPEENISDLLYLLDYSTQQQDFTDVMTRCKESAFLIQTENEMIQRWLVRRLAGCVPGFEKAKKSSIRISYSIRIDFNNFWQKFMLENNLNRETVIQELAKLCETKSVIIAIYGLSSLDEAEIHEFHQFWSDLVNKVRSISTSTQQRSFRSRLVLLLAEKNDSTVLDKLHIFNFIQPPEINENQYSISLAPLNMILRDDVENWLAPDYVYNFIDRKEDEIQSIVDDIQNSCKGKPYDVLNEICHTFFQVEYDITAIEPYWKLAG
ncbi:caspase family protein [Nostoc sp. CHAB 5784]|uniref:caspase family protein n=1 Tax=Nostoc mirabile TaxID=2907820 RepID=UPI001E61A2F4|nr:caspase family protein [Nostoc mirabile]MCC5664143.1 caspase family protein [Nostoc mirabile CHAB5784]